MAWTYIDKSELRGVEIFERIDERALEAVMVIMTTRDVKAGEVIFSEGQLGDALYIVLEGEIRIAKHIPGLGDEAVAFLKEGACFGELALIDERETRSASAVAHRDARLARLGRAEFLELVERDVTFGRDVLWGFVRVMTQRLRDTNDKVSFLALSGRFE